MPSHVFLVFEQTTAERLVLALLNHSSLLCLQCCSVSPPHWVLLCPSQLMMFGHSLLRAEASLAWHSARSPLSGVLACIPPLSHFLIKVQGAAPSKGVLGPLPWKPVIRRRQAAH